MRKSLQTVAFLGPAVALIVLSRSKDPRLAVACMTCALGITSLGRPLLFPFILCLIVWGMVPDVTHQTSWLGSTGLVTLKLSTA